jgi:hypothetical protein
MPTSVAVSALVHVAGPPEREPRVSATGFLLVQRCLRCDALLAAWPGRDAPPRNAYRLGRLVAAGADRGIAEFRYAIDDRRPRPDEIDCEPTPVEFL